MTLLFQHRPHLIVGVTHPLTRLVWGLEPHVIPLQPHLGDLIGGAILALCKFDHPVRVSLGQLRLRRRVRHEQPQEHRLGLLLVQLYRSSQPPPGDGILYGDPIRRLLLPGEEIHIARRQRHRYYGQNGNDHLISSLVSLHRLASSFFYMVLYHHSTLEDGRKKVWPGVSVYDMMRKESSDRQQARSIRSGPLFSNMQTCFIENTPICTPHFFIFFFSQGTMCDKMKCDIPVT